MRYHANCLGMTETADEPPVEQLEDAALGLYRRMCGLVEQSTRLAVAARGAVTAVNAGTFVVFETGAYQDASCLAVGNAVAVGPISAMICSAESTPKPGTAASRCTAS
jgi:hypothetical protein